MADTPRPGRMFIGGDWADSSGKTEPDINPRPATRVATVRSGRATTPTAPYDRCSEGLQRRRLVRHAAEGARWPWSTLSFRRRARRADADGLENADSRRTTSASRISVAAADIPFITDNLRFFAGAGPRAGGQVRRRVRARLHERDAAASLSRSPRASAPGTTRSAMAALEARSGAPPPATPRSIKPAELAAAPRHSATAELAADSLPRAVSHRRGDRPRLRGRRPAGPTPWPPTPQSRSSAAPRSTGPAHQAAAGAETVKRVPHLELGRQGPGRRVRRRRRRQARRDAEVLPGSGLARDCTGVVDRRRRQAPVVCDDLPRRARPGRPGPMEIFRSAHLRTVKAGRGDGTARLRPKQR